MMLIHMADRTSGSGTGSDQIGAALDEHIGTWSAKEAAELERHVADFEVIDEEM